MVTSRKTAPEGTKTAPAAKKKNTPAGKAAKPAAEKPGTAAKRAKPQAAKAAKPQATPADFETNGVLVRKKDFIDRIADRAGLKKPQARDVTEAVLAALGEALLRGESLALPPLGKLRVTKRTDTASGTVLVVKLKRASAEKTDETAGAEKTGETADAPLAEG